MDTKKPWEQLENEPDAAYARFLIYRNMGVGRSLFVASHIADDQPATKSKQKQISGTWTNDSTRYEWKQRAEAWDVFILADVGRNVVAKYVNALDLAFQRIVEVLQSGEVKPRTWGQLIESLTILGDFIPQETVSTIRQNLEDDSVPAIGTSQSDTTIITTQS